MLSRSWHRTAIVCQRCFAAALRWASKAVLLSQGKGHTRVIRNDIAACVQPPIGLALFVHLKSCILCDSGGGEQTYSNQVPYAGLCETMSTRQLHRHLQIQSQFGGTYAFASFRAVGLNFMTSGWLCVALEAGVWTKKKKVVATENQSSRGAMAGQGLPLHSGQRRATYL